MDETANAERDNQVATSTLQGKIATGDFDVFLCYNSADKIAVKDVGERLKRLGILPWLDQWGCGRACRGRDCWNSRLPISSQRRYSWARKGLARGSDRNWTRFFANSRGEVVQLYLWSYRMLPCSRTFHFSSKE